MKCLVDAHLPLKLSKSLQVIGLDSIHTLDLPAGNSSTDQEIVRVADEEDRVVITKDRDFIESHLIHGKPAKLLWIRTGNIPNHTLLTLLQAHIKEIRDAFQSSNCIELTVTGISVR
ncbi:MAG: DUF5615 family PIN-like protein [Pirellulaceae bacterium]